MYSNVQVYDAKTKQWTTVDQKKHTDVLEKISYLEESSGRTELNESERIKNLQSRDTVVSIEVWEGIERNIDSLFLTGQSHHQRSQRS